MEKKNYWELIGHNNHYVRNAEYARRLREVAIREKTYIMGYESDMMVTVFKCNDGIVESVTKMGKDILNDFIFRGNVDSDLSSFDGGPEVVLLRSGNTHLCPMRVNIIF